VYKENSLRVVVLLSLFIIYLSSKDIPRFQTRSSPEGLPDLVKVSIVTDLDVISPNIKKESLTDLTNLNAVILMTGTFLNYSVFRVTRGRPASRSGLEAGLAR
jgi:hypothetical protein